MPHFVLRDGMSADRIGRHTHRGMGPVEADEMLGELRIVCFAAGCDCADLKSIHWIVEKISCRGKSMDAQIGTGLAREQADWSET